MERKIIMDQMAILWDLDGTIIDTKSCHYQTWERAIKDSGYTMDTHAYNENFGIKSDFVVAKLLGFEPDEALKRRIIERKEALFRDMAPESVNLVAGVETWLEDANRYQISQAIASSAPTHNITMLLTNFSITKYFDVIVSGAEMAAKPEPDVFLEAAVQLGAEPKNCLVIEDSLAGVRAAKNAGMTCIAVATSHPASDYKLADMVIEDFTKPLCVILKRIGFSKFMLQK
jgi:beta-phosphoglucomutase